MKRLRRPIRVKGHIAAAAQPGARVFAADPAPRTPHKVLVETDRAAQYPLRVRTQNLADVVLVNREDRLHLGRADDNRLVRTQRAGRAGAGRVRLALMPKVDWMLPPLSASAAVEI